MCAGETSLSPCDLELVRDVAKAFDRAVSGRARTHPSVYLMSPSVESRSAAMSARWFARTRATLSNHQRKQRRGRETMTKIQPRPSERKRSARDGESAASAPGAGGGVVCGCDGVWMPPMIWLRIQCVIADSAVCTHDETAS